MEPHTIALGRCVRASVRTWSWSMSPVSESWLTSGTVLEPEDSSPADDPHADSVTRPRPTTAARNFLLFTVMTELPTQNDLGEVQRVCGPIAALSALWRSPVGYEDVRTSVRLPLGGRSEERRVGKEGRSR